MKRFIASALLVVFSCGIFVSYAADVGYKASTETVKKSFDLVAIEPATITVNQPVFAPLVFTEVALSSKVYANPIIPIINGPPK